MRRSPCLSVLIAVVACLAAFSIAEGAEPPRPNFIFIIADDLGWRDVGYHDSEIQTPVLDRLAAEGARLE